ncbi:MAG: DUF4333 domain-containing protein [Pseudoclavibacter sp.]|nr:DUF4333 domain-containing protein [Pseudoclavibacter sp.]
MSTGGFGGGFGTGPGAPPPTGFGGFGQQAPPPPGGFGGPATGPGGFGQGPGPAPLPAPPSRRRGGGARAVAAIGIPLALGLGLLGGWGLGVAGPGKLPAGQVESAVLAVLREDFGLSELERVDCPDRIENRQGAEFQCTFDYAGGPQSVKVVVSSKDGQLVVGSPGGGE